MNGTLEHAKLDRRHVVQTVLADRPDDLLVVTGLGSPTYDVAACGDNDLNFHLWGAMGSAATIGLGLATARPNNRVLVITGDGEMLMALGALASLGASPAANLAVLVIDNEAYGETGGQKSHTGHKVDLAAVATACRLVEARTAWHDDELAGLRQTLLSGRGPLLAVVKVGAEAHERVLPPRDGRVLRSRFRGALLGA
jgi:thiamine pyrophosphate-dependent acetolactate synthase large subunit-like protein